MEFKGCDLPVVLSVLNMKSADLRLSSPLFQTLLSAEGPLSLLVRVHETAQVP